MIPFFTATAQKMGDGSYVVRVLHSIDGTSTDITFPYGPHAESLAQEYVLFKNEVAQQAQLDERLDCSEEERRITQLNAATENLIELGKKFIEFEEKKAVSVTTNEQLIEMSQKTGQVQSTPVVSEEIKDENETTTESTE